jgi:hypothetical protein
MLTTVNTTQVHQGTLLFNTHIKPFIGSMVGSSRALQFGGGGVDSCKDSLEGRRVIVTGSNTGIGRCISLLIENAFE